MKDECIKIDGGMGEGGGQVLRSALALSMATGQPFRMFRIRANRPKPGLKRQHLTCVKAAQAVCRAEVRGDAVNSTELDFYPGAVQPGEYAFQVGTGGSVALVLQAVVPPLLFAGGPSRLTVSGGTHVPWAPPFEFMRDTLFPRLSALGPQLRAHMDRVGYMDIGGGSVTAEIIPAGPTEQAEPGSFALEEGGSFSGATAFIYAHGLPEGVVEREAAVLASRPYAALGLNEGNIEISQAGAPDSPEAGSGNMVLVKVCQGGFKTVFGECGWRGRSAEVVARQACKRALCFLRSGAPVEAHLADQLLVPLALAGGGTFVTERVTKHTQTCLDVIRLFTNAKTDVAPHEAGTRLTIYQKGC